MISDTEKKRIKEIRESLDRFEQNDNEEELIYIKNHLSEILWKRIINRS